MKLAQGLKTIRDKWEIIVNSTERECVDLFIKYRWNGKISCVRCNRTGIYTFKKKHGFFKCKKCQKIFSFKMKTILHNTNLPVQKWFLATLLHIQHTIDNERLSSINLGIMLDVKQTTAHKLLKKIRKVMNSNDIKDIAQSIEETLED